MRKLVAALLCSLLAVAALFGCSSEQTAEKKGCARTAECAPGLHCTPEHRCQQCAFDTQCPDSERCDRGSCVTRVTCSTNQDCASATNPICDSALKECVGCAADTDCDAPQRCFEHACQTVNGCTTEADCDSTEICQRGRCVASCQADADCTGVGLVCDYSSQTCKQCLISADCPSAYHCAAGRCERDACTAGASRCTKDGQGVELCSPAGDRWLTLFCAAAQNCDTNQGKASCSNWLCTPGTVGCSADARRVEVCAADGESLGVDHECAASQVCSAGACREVVCSPGLSYCQAGVVRHCSDDGTASALLEQCGSDSYCDDATAQCQKMVCTPGALSCQSNDAVRCKADGSGYETTAECDKSSVCAAGACRALVCEPNLRSCDGQGHMILCNANGTAGAIVDTCDGGQHCVDTASGALCVPAVCIANEVSCTGDAVAKCKADGTGLEPATVDCAASNQVCYAGACHDKLCTPNTLSCVQGNVFLCVQNGSTQQLFDTCTSNEYCDAASGACKTRICAPNTADCNDTVAATCNADGSGYLAAGAVDCAQGGKACVGGTCQARACTPNAFLCQAGDVYRCNSQGTATTLETNCTDSYQHCAQTGNVAFCAANACVAGSATCNGNVATKCLADGSGFEPGTDCGAQACVFGSCQPKVCVPDAPTCSSGNAYTCNSTGTALTLKQTCTAVQSCSGGACIPDVCAGGAQACLGEVLGVCNTDGSALSSTTTDCNATHQACSASGCAATVTDTLASGGSTVPGSSSQFMMDGDFVYVSSTRRLTLMQHTLTAAYQPKNLRWVIYRSDTAFGPYQLVFDQLGPVILGTALQSSNAMDVTLTAGKFYFLATVGEPGTNFKVETSTAQRYISFGHVLGNSTTTFSTLSNTLSISSFNTSFAPLVLTTTLP